MLGGSLRKIRCYARKICIGKMPELAFVGSDPHSRIQRFRISVFSLTLGPRWEILEGQDSREADAVACANVGTGPRQYGSDQRAVVGRCLVKRLFSHECGICWDAC